MRYVDNTTPGVAANFFGAGKGGYQDGDPAGGIRGTKFMADFENDQLGNLMQVLNRGGIVPTPGRADDLADAIQALIAATSGFSTGDVKATMRTTAAAGWVLMSGRTIGDGTSGATERANGDTAALFALLWANFDNTRLHIQDAGGTPTARGATAVDDFAAHKRMPLIDGRDYTIVGKGDMGGTAALRITGAINGFDTTVLGAVGGTEAHALTSDENGPHVHPAFVGSGANAGSTGGPVNGGGAGNTGSSGLGTPHPNVQPSLVLNLVVKL